MFLYPGKHCLHIGAHCHGNGHSAVFIFTSCLNKGVTALYVCYLWLSKKICINLWGQRSFSHKDTALRKTPNRTEHLLLCVSSIAPFPSVTLSHASLSQLQPHFPFNTYNFLVYLKSPSSFFSSFLCSHHVAESFWLSVLSSPSSPHSSLLHPRLLPPVFLHTAFSPSSMWIAGMVF